MNIKKLNEKLKQLLEDYGFCTKMKELLNQDGFERYDTFYNEKKQNFGVNLQNGKKVIFQWDGNGKYDFIDEQGNSIVWWGTNKSYVYEHNPVRLRDHLFTIARKQGTLKQKVNESEVKQYVHIDKLNSTKYPLKWSNYFYDDLYTEEQIKDIFKKSEEMVDILIHINNKNSKDERSLSYVPIPSVPYGRNHTQYWGVDEVGNTVSTREDKQAVYGVGLKQHYSKKNWVFLELYYEYTDKPGREVSKDIGSMIGYGTLNTLVSYEQFLNIYEQFKKNYRKYYDKEYNSIADINNCSLYL